MFRKTTNLKRINFFYNIKKIDLKRKYNLIL